MLAFFALCAFLLTFIRHRFFRYDALHFLVWRESDKSLTLLAKDYEPTQVFAAGMISRGGAMSFVCHDDRQNIQFLQYAPTDVAARGGNKLVCRADFHLGSQTTSLTSHWAQSSLLFNSCTVSSTLASLKQQDSLFGRLDDDQRYCLKYFILVALLFVQYDVSLTIQPASHMSPPGTLFQICSQLRND